MSWAEERARFPVLERFAYLNAGTFGPLSRATLDAMADAARWEAANGRGGKRVLRRDARAARARAGAARRADRACPPSNVALTESTTQGVHVVVTGLALGPATRS